MPSKAVLLLVGDYVEDYEVRCLSPIQLDVKLNLPLSLPLAFLSELVFRVESYVSATSSWEKFSFGILLTLELCSRSWCLFRHCRPSE